MIPKKNRLSSAQVAETKGQGEAKKTSNFIVIISPSKDKEPRFGVIITKKISPLAITRNALKRAIYKSIAGSIERIPAANYLIIPSSPILSPSHQQELTGVLKTT